MDGRKSALWRTVFSAVPSLLTSPRFKALGPRRQLVHRPLKVVDVTGAGCKSGETGPANRRDLVELRGRSLHEQACTDSMRGVNTPRHCWGSGRQQYLLIPVRRHETRVRDNYANRR